MLSLHLIVEGCLVYLLNGVYIFLIKFQIVENVMTGLDNDSLVIKEGYRKWGEIVWRHQSLATSMDLPSTVVYPSHIPSFPHSSFGGVNLSQISTSCRKYISFVYQSPSGPLICWFNYRPFNFHCWCYVNTHITLSLFFLSYILKLFLISLGKPVSINELIIDYVYTLSVEFQVPYNYLIIIDFYCIFLKFRLY